jgi:ABC-type transport system involved in multi-copper enzyme maturation permease subunit
MNIQKMKMIYINTLHKEYRNKALMFLLGFTLLAIVLLNGMVSFFYESFMDPKLGNFIGDKSAYVFFYFISFWTSLLGVLLGTGTIRSDFDDNVITQFLSFPIKRSEYLLARIFGTWTIVIGFFIISLATALILLMISAKGYYFGIESFIALMVSSLQILASITIAVVFSYFMPKVFAMMASLFLTSVIGSANAYFAGKEFFATLLENGLNFTKLMGGIMHAFLPRVGNISAFTNKLLMGSEIESIPWVTFGHFILSYAFLFLIAAFVLQRKDL